MAERDPAEGRLWKLSLLRLLGIVLATIGFVGIGKSGGHGAMLLIGVLLLVAGVATLLLGPRLLVRRWSK